MTGRNKTNIGSTTLAVDPFSSVKKCADPCKPSTFPPSDRQPVSYTDQVTSPTDPAIKRNRLILFALWLLFYASLALITPPLLDDADSVHAEVAREMLLRHDWVTLYANGIRYLEKAPLLYWSMAASFKFFGIRTAAARLPLAFTVLALALILEAFARRAFASIRAGLYGGLILLSSFGIFIFTRIIIPDAMVCLWLTLALYCYWLTEQQTQPQIRVPHLRDGLIALRWAFAKLTAILSVPWDQPKPAPLLRLRRLLCSQRPHQGPHRHRLSHPHRPRSPRAHPPQSPQHHHPHPPTPPNLKHPRLPLHRRTLAHPHRPRQPHPGPSRQPRLHPPPLAVPLPTDGNVHGWLWFYFINEHLLRYLNLRVPRDYDTVPLYLFWGLLLIWLMPFSAYLLRALRTVPWRKALRPIISIRALTETESTRLLLGLWAAIPLLFFSLSTRQEYYVLPSLPPLILLITAWLNDEATEAESFTVPNPLTRAGQRISVLLLVLGSIAALIAGFFVLHAHLSTPSSDLASLLKQNPSDYALSFGHFLDLNTQAMAAFRDPLILTAIALFGGTLANWLLRRNYKPHAANLWLIAATFAFLLAAHIGLQIFSPVLTSQQLAAAIAPVLRPDDLIIIHGEYESASSLGFYLQRPGPGTSPFTSSTAAAPTSGTVPSSPTPPKSSRTKSPST